MEKPIDDNTDIFQLIAAVRKHKVILVIFLILSQAVAATVWFTSPVRYSAVTQFIFKSGAVENPFSGIAALVGASPGRAGKNDVSAYFDIIIYTDEFLEKLLTRKWKAGGDSVTLAAVWKLPEGVSADSAVPAIRNQAGFFRKGKYLIIKKEVRPGLIEITTRFEDPDVAYDVNLQVVALLNEYLLNNNKSQASENRKFIQRRLEEVELDLKRSEDSYLSFALANKSVSSPSLFLESARRKRAVDIAQEVYLQLKKQVELAKIEERKEAPLIEVISRPLLPMGPDSRLTPKSWAIVTLAGGALGVIATLMAHFLAMAWRKRPD